jgi:membrane fusion protein (multidrug efflux system)
MSDAARILEFPEHSGNGGSKTPLWNKPGTWNSEYKKKFVLGLAGTLVFCLTSVLSYRWFIFAQSHIETNNAYVEGDVYHAQARMMGYVRDLSVKEGQIVKKGDLLLKLDDTDVLLEKGFKEAKLKKALADFHRGENLLGQKLISKSDFETLEAVLAANQADADATGLKLKYTEVFAPADGVIAKTYARPGQFIQPGQNLLTLVSQKDLWIKANYKETQIEKVKVGQKVIVEIDAFPDQLLSGEVEDIYPSSGSVVSLFPPENATGNFTKVVQRVSVKIALKNPKDLPLRPGMSVVTSIVLKRSPASASLEAP